MKLALLALVACMLVCAVAQDEFVQAFRERYSWETIFVNNTSFLDEIDVHNNVIFVSGEGYVREIVENPFEVSLHHTYFRQHRYRFIDFKVFEHRNVSYVIGPISNGDLPNAGVGHPLMISSLNDEDTAIIGAGNFQIGAVAATDMNGDHVVVYAVGWIVDEDDNGNFDAELYLVRMFVHPNHTQYHNGSFISFNATMDVVPLPGSTIYTEYHRAFKPWIFHSSTLQQVIIVDPASDLVYRVKAPNMRNQSIEFLDTETVAFSSTNITAATYDHGTHLLVIGTKARGSYPGTIVVIDAAQWRVVFSRTLANWESNPKALHVHRGTELFVGLFGWHYILRLDLTNGGNVLGYSTLPWWERSVHDLYAHHSHLYVVTNEQYSKVARTEYIHFCATPCDSLYGYCNNGTCACHAGHMVNPNQISSCQLNYTSPAQPTQSPGQNQGPKEEKSGYGGEIAFGILFALCFVAGAAGWLVVVRVNVQGKQMFGFGKSRYSALNGEEKEGFLADE